MHNFDWEGLAKKLPTARTMEDRRKRLNIFSRIDVNGNGFLSLAEVDKGIRDVLRIDSIFNAKPVIMRAF